jgi:hypothetical protein
MSENDGDDYKNFKIEEEMYKFKADKLPFSRNVLYQLCDIEDDDIQKLIQSEENIVKLIKFQLRSLAKVIFSFLYKVKPMYRERRLVLNQHSRQVSQHHEL